MSSIHPIKKLSSIISITLLATSLTACGGGSDSGSQSNSSPDNPPSSATSDKCKEVTAGGLGQADLDKDGNIDDCDSDIDGDGIENTKDAKPMDATIAGISTKSYRGYGFGYVNATEVAYFNAKKQLIETEYLSSYNPERANSSEKFTYDNKDRLIRLESTRGIDKQIDSIKVWVYNEKDQLTEYKVNDDADSIFEKTKSYQYNLNGDIEKIIESDISSTRSTDNLTRTFIYNTLGQLEQITTDDFNDSSIEQVVDLNYDDNNHISKSYHYYVDVDNSGVKNLYKTFEYTYDNKGNVLTDILSYARGGMNSTSYVYDSQNNIIGRTIISGSTTADVHVSYDTVGLATSSTSTYRGFRTNVQDVSTRAKYNNEGYLINSSVDVSQDGNIDQEIVYTYQGVVPLKFNVAPFLHLGYFFDKAPTATTVLHRVNTGYTANTVKEKYYN